MKGSIRVSSIGSACAIATWLAFILLGISVFCVPPASAGSVQWPEEDQWHPVMKSGGPLGDPAGDFPGGQGNGLGYLDFVNGPDGYAFAWTFDGNYLFFRLVLRGSPLHSGQDDQLRPDAWIVYINAVQPNEEDHTHADFAIVLDKNGMRTAYWDGSNFENVSDEFAAKADGFRAPTSPDPYHYIYENSECDDCGFMTRAAAVDDDEDLWYLEFFVPISWLSVPQSESGGTGPGAVEPTSLVRTGFATSTQLNNIHKDAAGLANGYHPNTEQTSLFSFIQFAGVQSDALITERTTIVGQSVKYPVMVRNTGNGTDTFQLALDTAPSAWSWSVHENVDGMPGEALTKVTLPPDGTADLFVIVTPGENVDPGTTLSVTLTITSGFDETELSDESFATVAVGNPAALILVSGHQQTGFPGSELEHPLRTRVVDANGNGVPGIAIDFSVATAPVDAVGYSLCASCGISDDQGYAQTSFKLGSELGLYQITAAAEGLNGSPLTFSAYAWNGTPAKIVWLGPDEANVGDLETLSIEVRNAQGDRTVVTTPTTVELRTGVGNTVPFFEDTQATLPITSRTFAAGDSTVRFYYRETKAGLAVLTAERISGESVGSADHEITLVAGPPAQLAFTQQPLDAETHATLEPVVVQIQDVYGNHVPPAGETIISLTITPANEGELLGTTSLTMAPDGSATFTDLAVNRFGVKRLQASAPEITSAESVDFTIWGSYLETSTYSVTPASPVLRGTILTYTAEIVNTGNTPTRGALLTVQIPEGTSYVSAQSEMCTNLSGPIEGAMHCELDDVADGKSAILTFDVKVDQSTPDCAELLGSAVVKDDWNEKTLPSGDPLLTIVHAPVIHLTQNVWPGHQVAPGETIRVTIELTNAGHAHATNVVVVGRVPASVRYETGSAESSNGAAAVTFQHEEGGGWRETDLDDEGAPVPVVAIRWVVPEIEALVGQDAFEYEAYLP